MAVSLSPGQWEYVQDNSTERNANWTLVLVEPGKFELRDWMDILSLLIALLGLAGNGTVLWLLGFSIQRNPFSVYILNLAGADALFLCCSSLVSLHEFVNSWHYSFKFEVLIYFACTFYTVGLSLLAAISTERCLAALFPAWYLHGRPKRTSAVLCAGFWALAGLFFLADLLLCDVMSSQSSCGPVLSFQIVWFVHFTPVLCVSSLTLLLRVQCSSQRRQPPRLYLLVLLMVLIFLICGLLGGIDVGIWSFPLYTRPYSLFVLLAYLKSSTYPFIYFLLGSQGHRRGREPLRVILQRALADEQDLEDVRKDSRYTHTLETSFT